MALTGVVCACLLLLLQAGYALNEAGLSRARNAANVMLRSFANLSAGGLMFWMAGFGLMFGASNGVIGSSHFLLTPAPNSDEGVYVLFLQQALCAVTIGAIVFGATAERMRFGPGVLLSVLLAGLVYPVGGHWVWGELLEKTNTSSGAWLAAKGFIDLGGSAVIHCTGGFAALAAAMAVGPRLGKFGRDGSARLISGHNLTLAAFGVLLLFTGWFGFITGTSGQRSDSSLGKIATNVLLAGFSGSTAAMLVAWLRFGKPDVSMTLNGALAGLVAISAGCGTTYPAFSIAIGAIAGSLVVFAVVFLDHARVDDPVGAISVHGVCGLFGTLAAGVLHEASFDGRGWNPLEHLWTQALGAGVISAWSFVTTFVLLKAIDLITPVRVSAEDEISGLDLAEHGATAYGGALADSVPPAPVDVPQQSRKALVGLTETQPSR